MMRIIRFFLYKFMFRGSVVSCDAKVSKLSYIGKYVRLFSNVEILDSVVSDYTYIQKNSVLNRVKVDRFCSIGSNVVVGLANHPLSFISTSPVFFDNECPLPRFLVDSKVYKGGYIAPTVIEADVWIGEGSIIKSGIKVGVGSVIAAGSVVTHDVLPYSIVGGVPASVIRFRFESDLRSKLLESKWWELSDAELAKLSSFFNNPSEFLNNIP